MPAHEGCENDAGLTSDRRDDAVEAAKLFARDSDDRRRSIGERDPRPCARIEPLAATPIDINAIVQKIVALRLAPGVLEGALAALQRLARIVVSGRIGVEQDGALYGKP